MEGRASNAAHGNAASGLRNVGQSLWHFPPLVLLFLPADGLDLRTITGKSADGEALSRVVLRSLEPHIEAGLVQCLTEEDEQREQQQRAGASGRGGSGAADERAAAQQRQQGPSGGEVVRVRLTDPQGFVVSNDIISDVFAALDGDGAGSDED